MWDFVELMEIPHTLACVLLYLCRSVTLLCCTAMFKKITSLIIMLMLMLIFVTRLNFRRSRSADIYYGQSKLRWYRCVLSCDRNEPTLEAARIVVGRLFQTLGAAIEKRRDAVLVLERGTDSMSRDDERRLRVGLYCSSSDDK